MLGHSLKRKERKREKTKHREIALIYMSYLSLTYPFKILKKINQFLYFKRINFFFADKNNPPFLDVPHIYKICVCFDSNGRSSVHFKKLQSVLARNKPIRRLFVPFLVELNSHQYESKERPLGL